MILFITSQAILTLAILGNTLFAKDTNPVSSWLLFRGNPQQDGFLPKSIKGPFHIECIISLKDSIE